MVQIKDTKELEHILSMSCDPYVKVFKLSALIIKEHPKMHADIVHFESENMVLNPLPLDGHHA